jgi:threonine dehydratase
MGVRCEVLVPETSRQAKRSKLAELGAVLTVGGAGYAEALTWRHLASSHTADALVSTLSVDVPKGTCPPLTCGILTCPPPAIPT